MVLGSGCSTIALTFQESAEILLVDMMNPRKTTSDCKKEHVAKLMYSFSAWEPQRPTASVSDVLAYKGCKLECHQDTLPKTSQWKGEEYESWLSWKY